MDFSDVDNASSEVGSEAVEVENKDSDYGDGDGVNDFDETYNEMQQDSSDFKYDDGSNSDAPQSDLGSEEESDMSSEEKADSIDTGIEDDIPAESEPASDYNDNQASEDMSSEERADAYNDAFEDELIDDTDQIDSGDNLNVQDAEDNDTDVATNDNDVNDSTGVDGNVDGEDSEFSEDKSSSTDINNDESEGSEDVDTAVDETADETGNDVPDDTDPKDADVAVEPDTNETDVDDIDDQTDAVEGNDTDTTEATAETDDDTIDTSGEADSEDGADDNKQNNAEMANEGTSEDTVEDESTNGSEIENEDDSSDETDSVDSGSEANDGTGTEKSDTDKDVTDETEGGKADPESTDESAVENEADSDVPESKNSMYGNDASEAEGDVSDESDIDSDNIDSDSEEADSSGEDMGEKPAYGDESGEGTSDSDILDTSSESDDIEDSDDNDSVNNYEENRSDDGLDSEINEGVSDNNIDVMRRPEAENPNLESDVSSDGVDSTGDMYDESTGDVSDSPQDNADTTSEGVIQNPGVENQGQLENCSYHQGQNDVGALGTCGPTSIANSLNRVTGTNDYSENGVLHSAMDNDLCRKSDNPYACGGTTTKDVVDIIDKVKDPESNIHTEVYDYDKALDVDSLAARLDDSGTVAMVGVDSATLWDQRGDVSNSGLFQGASESPSDHWITVDSPVRDENGNVTGFNIVDSGGGVGFVERDKFERMYMGDDNHRVSDPTAILVSNKGKAVNSYAQPEGVERASYYKGEGSAVKSDGNGPPEKSEIRTGVKNTECDINGDVLAEEAKEINDKFRGDSFEACNSFESTFNDVERKELIEKNAATTCGLNENLDGKIDGIKFATVDKTSVLEAREKVPEIKPDTVMQKVIPAGQVDNYLNGDWTQVRNCCSKAEDTAPYVSCGSDAYKELRLDYKGNDAEGCNVRELEKDADLYVIRFTSDTNPSEIGVPNDAHPCTGTGFTGSEDHLIPEYKYPATTPTDGAIYKIDADGNETMVGIWDKDANRFYPVP